MARSKQSLKRRVALKTRNKIIETKVKQQVQRETIRDKIAVGIYKQKVEYLQQRLDALEAILDDEGITKPEPAPNPMAQHTGLIEKALGDVFPGGIITQDEEE